MRNYLKVASLSLVFLSSTSAGSLAKMEVENPTLENIHSLALRSHEEGKSGNQHVPTDETSADEQAGPSMFSRYAWSGASMVANAAYTMAWNSANQYVRANIAYRLSGLLLEPLIEGTATVAYCGGYALGAISPIPGAGPVLGTASYFTTRTVLNGVRYIPGADNLLMTGFAMALRYVTDPAIDYLVIPAMVAATPVITSAGYSALSAGASWAQSWYS